MEFELRKLEANDAESICKYANNINVARNLRNLFPSPYDIEDAKRFINFVAKQGDNIYCRAIVVNGEAVGCITVSPQNDIYEKCAELGYWLGEPFWGKGIVTEAVKRACADAFSGYDIVRIWADAFEHNAGSRRVLEKAGFTLEGILKKAIYKQGKIYNACMYALVR